MLNNVIHSETGPSSPARPSTSRRICPYGSTCYRKNPQHRVDEAHPGDPDYKVSI